MMPGGNLVFSTVLILKSCSLFAYCLHACVFLNICYNGNENDDGNDDDTINNDIDWLLICIIRPIRNWFACRPHRWNNCNFMPRKISQLCKAVHTVLSHNWFLSLYIMEYLWRGVCVYVWALCLLHTMHLFHFILRILLSWWCSNIGLLPFVSPHFVMNVDVKLTPNAASVLIFKLFRLCIPPRFILPSSST